LSRDRHAEKTGAGGEGLASLIAGLHDVRIPVRDPWVSRSWYMSVFSFEAILDLQEEPGLVGVVLRHASGAVIGLHHDEERASAMRGFVTLALTVADMPGLQACARALDGLGQARGDIQVGHLGWYLDVPDPDGILIRLHTETEVDAEEA
jgi:hypothetical protein